VDIQHLLAGQYTCGGERLIGNCLKCLMRYGGGLLWRVDAQTVPRELDGAGTVVRSHIAWTNKSLHKALHKSLQRQHKDMNM
jgi:hypothetical protein